MNQRLLALPAGLLAVAGGLTIGHLQPAAHAAHTEHTTAGQPFTGTVAAVSERGATLSIRTGTTLHTMTTNAITLRTANGSRLPTADLRSGDHVSASHGTVRDLSQRTETVQGVVAVEGATSGSPLVVQLKSNYSIVVDLTPSTRYSDPSGQTTSTSQIEDADIVKLSGTYDTRLGEMTQVTAVVRTGPYRQAGTKRG